ncbi:MAG: hypothetical protein ACOCUB_01825 [Desulfohalobiaceae bacterium]
MGIRAQGHFDSGFLRSPEVNVIQIQALRLTLIPKLKFQFPLIYLGMTCMVGIYSSWSTQREL